MKRPMLRTPALALFSTLIVGVLAACGASTAQTPTAQPTAMAAPIAMPAATAMPAPTAMAAPTPMASTDMNAMETVGAVAMADSQFSTLVELVIAADLPPVLNGPGPLTVFAPTNDAFAKLPAATIDALKADPAMLKEVLSYHVLSTRVTSADVAGMGGMGTPETLSGAALNVTTIDGSVYVNDAMVIIPDLMASNGVIHAIDTVLIPPSMMMAATIGGTAMANPQFNTLSTLVTIAGLGSVIKDPEAQLTVFAPTDEAFAKLPQATVEGLMADKEALTKVLLYHVVEGVITSEDIAGMGGAGMPATVNGAQVDVTTRAGSIFVNDAEVVSADMMVGNGVIHAIDTVLLPPDMR